MHYLSISTRDIPQATRGGTREGCGIIRGSARGCPQASGGRRVCYVILDRAEAEAFDEVITGIIPVCHCSSSILFDPSSTYSYVLGYFAFDMNIMSEPLVKHIFVSTSIGKSLVVNEYIKVVL